MTSTAATLKLSGKVMGPIPVKLVKSCEVEVGVTLYETEIFSTLLWSPTMFRLLMTLPSGLSVVVRSMLIVAVLLLISSGAVDPGLKFSAVYGLIGCGLM